MVLRPHVIMSFKENCVERFALGPNKRQASELVSNATSSEPTLPKEEKGVSVPALLKLTTEYVSRITNILDFDISDFSPLLLKGGDDEEDESKSADPVDGDINKPTSQTALPKVVEPRDSLVVNPVVAPTAKTTGKATGLLGENYNPSSIWNESLRVSYEGKDFFRSALEGVFYSGDSILLNSERVLEGLFPYLDNLVGVIPLTLKGSSLGWEYSPEYHFSDNSMLKHPEEPRLCEYEFLPLYEVERDCTIVRSYPSCKTYEVAIDGELASKLSSGFSMMKETKFFQAYLGLKDLEAQTFVRAIMDNYRNGDNHLTFLIRGWLYWLASNTAVNTGGTTYMTPNFDIGRYRSVVSVSDLIMDLRSGNCHLVWADDPDINYVHFLTALSHNGEPVFRHYYRIQEGGARYIARDSLVGLQTQRSILVAGTYNHQLAGIIPSWVNDPMLIKSYLIRYASSIGIGEQLFDAMKIAFYMSEFQSIGVVFRCPEPLHYSDLFHWVTGAPIINEKSFSLTQFAGIKHKLSVNLLSRMIKLGINDFQESVLAERINPTTSRLDEQTYMDMLTMDRISLERMLLGLMGAIVGYDFTVLIHMDVQRHSTQLLDLSMTRASYEGGFIRLLIPSYPVKTITAMIRSSYKFSFADVNMMSATTTYDEYLMFFMMKMLNVGNELDIRGVSWYYPVLLKQHLNIPNQRRNIWIYLRNKSLSLQIVDIKSKLPDRYIPSDKYHDSVKSIGKADWSTVISSRENLVIAEALKRSAKAIIGGKPTKDKEGKKGRDKKNIIDSLPPIPEEKKEGKVLFEEPKPKFETSESKDTPIDMAEQKRISDLIVEAARIDAERIQKAEKDKLKKLKEEEALMRRKIVEMDKKQAEEKRKDDKGKKTFQEAVETEDVSGFSEIEEKLRDILRKSPSSLYDDLIAVQRDLEVNNIDVQKVNFDKLIRYANEFLDTHLKPKGAAKPLSDTQKRELLLAEKKMSVLYPDTPLRDYRIENAYMVWFDSHKLKVIDCGSGGNCGPNVAAFQVCRYLGKGVVSSKSIRKQVAEKFSLLPIDGEWWDELDFLAVAVLYDLGLAIRSDKGKWRFPRYGNRIMTVQCTGNCHWQSVVPDFPSGAKGVVQSNPPVLGKGILRGAKSGRSQKGDSDALAKAKEERMQSKKKAEGSKAEIDDKKKPVEKDSKPTSKNGDKKTADKASKSDKILDKSKDKKLNQEPEIPKPKDLKEEYLEEKKKTHLTKLERKRNKKEKKREALERMLMLKHDKRYFELAGLERPSRKDDQDKPDLDEENKKSEDKSANEPEIPKGPDLSKDEDKPGDRKKWGDYPPNSEDKPNTEEVNPSLKLVLSQDINLSQIYDMAKKQLESDNPGVDLSEDREWVRKISGMAFYQTGYASDVLVACSTILCTAMNLGIWGLSWPIKPKLNYKEPIGYLNHLNATEVESQTRLLWVKRRLEVGYGLMGDEWFNRVVEPDSFFGAPGLYKGLLGFARYCEQKARCTVSETRSIENYQWSEKSDVSRYSDIPPPSDIASDSCVYTELERERSRHGGAEFLRMKSLLLINRIKRSRDVSKYGGHVNKFRPMIKSFSKEYEDRKNRVGLEGPEPSHPINLPNVMDSEPNIERDVERNIQSPRDISPNQVDDESKIISGGE